MMEKSFHTVLAIDTSTRYLRLALSYRGDRVVKIREDAEQSHGQMIMRKIDDLFASTERTVSDLDGIVVCTGPGSFTGLRIGIAAAKGMALAADVPIVGVSIFEVAAYLLRSESRAVEIITAVRRDEFIIGRVTEGNSHAKDVRVVPASELTTAIADRLFAFVGLTNHLPPDVSLGGRNVSHRIDFDAVHILEIGKAKFEAGISDDIASLEPLYIQKSQAEIRFEARQRK